MARKYLNKLEGKLVVVIGGTSGIGLAVAEASVEHGAHVVVASRTQENIDNAVERLKQSYPEFAENVRGHPCNNSSSNAEAEIVKLFDFVTDSGAKKIDHIIDTSGETGPVVGKLEDVTSEIWLEDYRVRLVGAALVGKNAAKYMRQESSSSYTMTSGVLTARPMKGLSPRLTAGGAKETLTRTLAVDLAPIRVNLVAPGAIDTPILQKMFARAGPGAEERFKAGTLVKQIGTVEDVAESYLCSMKNRFLTGTVSFPEGGFLLT